MAYKLLIFFFSVYVQIAWSFVGTNDTSLIENLGIYGGKEIPIEAAPYMVALHIPRTDGKKYFCGGSIIHEQFVLTAAHCFRDSIIPLVKGYVGTANLKDLKAPIKVEEKICHEGFTDNPLKTSKNDICILKLTEPLEFNEQVNKVKWAKKGLVVNPKILANVIGWGETENGEEVENLRQVEIRIVRNNNCRKKDKRILCAGSQGKGSCHGDSGGPLIYEETQIGVVSYNPEEGCTSKYGDVYTKVASYSNWIATVIRKHKVKVNYSQKTPII